MRLLNLTLLSFFGFVATSSVVSAATEHRPNIDGCNGLSYACDIRITKTNVPRNYTFDPVVITPATATSKSEYYYSLSVYLLATQVHT